MGLLAALQGLVYAPRSPIQVTLNTRVSSKLLGTYNNNNSFFDPLTGVNLGIGHLTSGDLSAFTPAQLANIASAVRLGTLSVTVGTIPDPDITAYQTFNPFVSAGKSGGPGWTGITGVDDSHY